MYNMKWITRERPKIDRIACPWLIKKFIDKDAEFMFVPDAKVVSMAKKVDAIPYDIPNVEYTHEGELCTFDVLVKKYRLEDPSLQIIAKIVRGADTERFDLTPQSAGLWAISSGLSYNFKNDFEMLEVGLKIYDALYSWARYTYDERHTWEHIMVSNK
jgi:hypothetical protein